MGKRTKKIKKNEIKCKEYIMVADGSMTKNLSIYEKMLENPDGRKRSYMKQPMPNSAAIKGVAKGKVDTSKINEVNPGEKKSDISPEEQDWLSNIDNRMAMRRKGQLPAIQESGGNSDIRIQKLEKQVSEMQELLIEVMKTHMKLLAK